MALSTRLTELLGIRHPVMLAGMNGVSHAELAAAVSNAGGIGSIGGLLMSPKALSKEIARLKQGLSEPSLPFGVDLAIPQLGGTARKTNHDYTHGHLEELIDIIAASGAKLFICAVGVPPCWVMEKLHAAQVLVANMVGSVRNAEKALEAKVDLIIAQGTEGGGHTGEIGTMCLIPQVVDLCRSRAVPCVCAGGIFDGRGLAAALSLGACGVWVGTRFICAQEAAAPRAHKEKVLRAESVDTMRTLVISGRPLRLIPNDWVRSWEEEPEKIKDFCQRGVIPLEHDLKEDNKQKRLAIFDAVNSLAGQAVGGVNSILPAKQIVEDMVNEAVAVLKSNAGMISRL